MISALLLALWLQVALPSPTPVPSPEPWPTLGISIPDNDIYNQLSTAAANVNTLPDDLSRDSNGLPLLPTSDASTIFSYAKWLFSSGDELIGRTMSPIATTVWIALVLIVTLVAVYLVVWLVILILRFVKFLINQALKFVPFLGTMILIQIPPTPTPFPVAPAAPLTIPRQSMWEFADDAIQMWHRFGTAPPQVLQIVLIIMIIIVSVFFLVRKLRDLSDESRGEL